MKTFQIADRIAARTIDGQTFLVIIDEGNLHTLSEVGSFLWDRIEGATEDDLVAQVLENFDVKTEQARDDIRAFIDDLLEIGALVDTSKAEIEDGTKGETSRDR